MITQEDAYSALVDAVLKQQSAITQARDVESARHAGHRTRAAVIAAAILLTKTFTPNSDVITDQIDPTPES